MFIPNLYNERGKFYMFIFFVHSYFFLCHILVSLSLRLIYFLCWKLTLCAYYTVISIMYLIKEGVYRYGPTILGLHSECMRMYRPYRPFVIGYLCVS